MTSPLAAAHAFAPLAVIFGLAVPAMAAEQRVGFADLDLNRPADAAAFAARIDAAADSLCKAHGLSPIAIGEQRRLCRTAAREEACGSCRASPGAPSPRLCAILKPRPRSAWRTRADYAAVPAH